jgi:hypothetical protein
MFQDYTAVKNIYKLTKTRYKAVLKLNTSTNVYLPFDVMKLSLHLVIIKYLSISMLSRMEINKKREN